MQTIYCNHNTKIKHSAKAANETGIKQYAQHLPHRRASQ